jgi:hypothetical protein
VRPDRGAVQCNLDPGKDERRETQIRVLRSDGRRRPSDNPLQQENFMAQKNKGPSQNKKTTPPRADKIAKENQREKAEGKEVAGRHKNDGQKDHKGSR